MIHCLAMAAIATIIGVAFATTNSIDLKPSTPKWLVSGRTIERISADEEIVRVDYKNDDHHYAYVIPGTTMRFELMGMGVSSQAGAPLIIHALRGMYEKGTMEILSVSYTTGRGYLITSRLANGTVRADWLNVASKKFGRFIEKEMALRKPDWKYVGVDEDIDGLIFEAEE